MQSGRLALSGSSTNVDTLTREECALLETPRYWPTLQVLLSREKVFDTRFHLVTSFV